MPFDATLSDERLQAIILEEAVSPMVTISIYAGSVPLASVDVVVPSLGREVAFDLSLLPPSLISYDLRCEVVHEGRTITFASDELRVLPPNPWNGGTVKIDRRTGGVLVPAEDEEEGWQPIIPAGFYTSYDDYLAKDGRHLDEMKALGFNLVHPVPTFSDLDVLKKILDHARDIGLWLMYDMRHTFEDLASVREQAELIRSYSNLLVWYTADEPDGHESPLDSTKRPYDLLRSPDVDAGYHPVSVVLNCANYFFEPYASGADIVLTDPYPFNVNGTFSNVWHTPCNATYGVCGCDNCFTSSILDVSDRIDAYVGFRRQLGRERSLAFWAVPQAFGGSEFWTAVPTGAEFAQNAVLSLIHGCLGLVPWIAPSTPEIIDTFSKISKSLASGLAQDFILSPRASKTLLPPSKGVHLAAWTIPTNSGSVKLLVLGARVAHPATNEPVEIQLRKLGISGHKDWAIRDVFGLGGSGKVVVELHSTPEGAVLVGEVLGDQGVVAWVLESSLEETS